MKLQTRLLLTMAPLAAALIVIGLVSLRTFDALGRSSQRILQDNYRSVLAARRMKEAAERIDSAAAFRAAGRADKADQQAPPNIESFGRELEVEEHNLTEPGEEQATKQLSETWSEYQAKYRSYSGLTDAEQLRRKYFEEMEPAFVQLKRAADHILDINQDAMVRKSEEARRESDQQRSFLLLTLIGALALGMSASISLTARALRPLRALSGVVRKIGEGDLDARAKLEGSDEIARVGRELDVMADKLREYRSSSLGELLQAQQASQAAIDSLPDPVLVISVDGKVLNVNQAAESLLRIEAGSDPLSSMPPELRAAVEKVRDHVIGGKGAYSPKGLEEAVRTNVAALLPRATPLYSETGGVLGVTIVLQEVTRLLRFDELKNDLVATVAHEFRTPLTSLRMALHVLIEGIVGPLNEKQLEMVHAAREDCERLQGIVEDLLDLSRIQAGKIELSLQPVTVQQLIGPREVTLQLANPETLVMADAERIGLVFDNLINNALRHAPAGSQITVRSRDEQGKVRFEVHDEGPGVPPEYQHRIFEKFFRVPGTKGEGVGLGLYISREIVVAHGGDMGVDGSTFWFTLKSRP